MASVQVWSLQVLLLLLTTLSGVVCADDYSIGGLVAAAGVAFIFLAIVITMLVVGFTWNSWYPDLQLSKGMVKMPREYWKKKEEAKRRLLNGSRTALTSLAAPSENGLPNGTPPSRIQDTEENKSDRASWVQGWNNANAASDRGYEEMALAMDLGDEKDDEFRIETTVVDNETLDLGPFKDSDGQGTGTGTATAGTSQQTATMEMTEEVDGEAYLYSVVDPTRKASRRSAGGENPADAPEAVTSFSKLDHHLVSL